MKLETAVPESAPVHREAVRVFAALSDENRYRIVQLLAEGPELSCGAIGTALGLSPSLLSHHLSVLEEVRVVERRKQGLWTLNRLRRDELQRHVDELGRLARSAGPAHAPAPELPA